MSVNNLGINVSNNALPKQSSVDLSEMASKKQAQQDYSKNLAGLKKFAASQTPVNNLEKKNWVI